MSQFWNLPGPTRYLNQIADDLRAGNNVVVALPEGCPDGWLAFLKRRLREFGMKKPEEIRLGGRTPAQELAHHCRVENYPGFSAVDLTGAKSFQGGTFYVWPRSNPDWQAWRGFLAEYEEACKQLSIAERAVILVRLTGAAADGLPEATNLLRVHRSAEWCRQLTVSILADLHIHLALVISG